MIPKHERDYGTLADFHTLIDSAHARGIKVVIDFVMNHSSEFHPWFVNSASSSNSTYRHWYIWRDTNPGYLGPWGQPVWHPRNGAYYYGIFWSGMPDLNYANEAVKNEMFDVAKFWLETMRVDGFRLDAIKHLFEDGTIMENAPATFEFLKTFRQFYKDEACRRDLFDPAGHTVHLLWRGNRHDRQRPRRKQADADAMVVRRQCRIYDRPAVVCDQFQLRHVQRAGHAGGPELAVAVVSHTHCRPQ
ncbi:hypothetical protein L0337_15295 [candidate division KSB1 bacterium]|nr:hypothetical protein [candidate division KSB1 bacterium]